MQNIDRELKLEYRRGKADGIVLSKVEGIGEGILLTVRAMYASLKRSNTPAEMIVKAFEAVGLTDVDI